MKFLVVHPGASVSIHDVFMGLIEGLKDNGHELRVYPLDRKIAAAGTYLNAQRQMEIHELKMDLPEEVKQDEIILQASEGLVVQALWGHFDWVLIVSGMYLPLHVLHTLRMAGIKVALLLTESPYDEAKEAKWAKAADVVFTNERLTAARLGVHYLPHAWRRGVHDRNRAQLASQLPPGGQHECVFVGTGFGERVTWLQRYAAAGGPLTLYGTWPQDEMRPYLADPERDEWVTTNEQTAALYAHAGCSLNLYRTSKFDSGFSDAPQHIDAAESMNPRAYELAALGCFHVSTPRAEIEEKFGALVPQARTPEEGAEMALALLAVPEHVRESLREQLRKCVEHDTWHERARQIVDVLSR